MGFLFIGGPVHGTRRVVATNRFEVYDIDNAFPSLTSRYLDPISDRVVQSRRVVYSRRLVKLGCGAVTPSTSVWVMAPEGMSDDAVARAAADFLDGVERR